MGSITGKQWRDSPDLSTPIMAADLEAIEAGIVDAQQAAAAASAPTIVGAGRPDIPATLTTPGTAALVAAATSGTVFRSTDGPQGAWEWQKRGSTWIVTNADTGWRAAPLINGWTGTPLLRRTATGAYLRLSTGNGRLSGSEATSSGFLVLPDGFQLVSNNYNVMGVLSTFGGSSLTVVQQSTNHTLSVSQLGNDLTGLIHWLPQPGYPTSLPPAAG